MQIFWVAFSWLFGCKCYSFLKGIIAENVIEYFLEIKYWNFIIMLWQLDEQNIL